MMRTTVDIPDDIYRDLKIKAVQEKLPVRQIILRSIQRELGANESQPVRKLQLPLIHSARPGTLSLTNELIDEIAFGDPLAS
ncbi:hypothetical protein DYQ86_19880 [Acidobacteria bacterium AB60]|nr:hypothetical protein DYQ86_19880 [Acidobacteria bacterium AB60]